MSQGGTLGLFESLPAVYLLILLLFFQDEENFSQITGIVLNSLSLFFFSLFLYYRALKRNVKYNLCGKSAKTFGFITSFSYLAASQEHGCERESYRQGLSQPARHTGVMPSRC